MTYKLVKVLDYPHKRAFIEKAHKVYNDSYRFHTLPIEYLDKMFSFNELFCFKCGYPIQVGSKYSTNRNGKRNIVKKYYHSSCYESMFQ